MSRIKTLASKLRKSGIFAAAWLNRRRLSSIPVIGITGSAGKTTTKELCVSVLAPFGACVSTERSKNTWMSAAKLMLRLTSKTRFCVAEMGIMRPGGLNLTLKLAQPTIGVFTLVARDHYSAFRSLEAIAEEKSKLIFALPRSGTAIINIDDALVRRVGEQAPCKVITIGRDEHADIRLISARSVWPEPLTLQVRVFGEEHTVKTQLHGEHLALNVLATLGVTSALHLPLDRVLASLESADQAEGRMQPVIGADGVTFLRDDFKAPQWSFHAPLEVLKSSSALRKIVVVGTVSDSPDSPSKRYLRIARDVRKIADLAVFIGRDAQKALKARSSPDDASIQAFTQLEYASAFLKRELRRGDLVLLKGTNKQDHLVRLILDRENPISCWRENCEIEAFCSTCRLLHRAESNKREVRDPDATPMDFCDPSAATNVIVGLGNPGDRYADTPHNAGHMFVDGLALAFGSRWESHRLGKVCAVEMDGKRVLLFKPGTLMNVSGEPVRDFLHEIGGHPHLLSVAHDEIDLELGDVRLKKGGGDAGHKGIRSVIAGLGTEAFTRVRLGVRSSVDNRKAKEIVLERFSAAQLEVLRGACQRAGELVRATSTMPTA